MNESAVSGLSFDLAAAQRDFEASQDGEINLWLHVSWEEKLTPYQSDVSEVWRDQLGIEVTISEHLDIPPEGWHMMTVDLHATYPSAHGILLAFVNAFGAEKMPPEFAEIRGMISEAASKLDNAERARRYDAIERHILDSALAIPLQALEPHRTFLIQPWVHGLEYPRYSGSAFHDAWLDDSAPKRTLP